MDQKVINAIVKKAIKLGVNYVDTAPFYGQGESERRLGIALKNIPRNAFYIATKVHILNINIEIHFLYIIYIYIYIYYLYIYTVFICFLFLSDKITPVLEEEVWKAPLQEGLW